MNQHTDRLTTGTWEPPEHLEGTDLISKWKQAKQELGKVAFQRENEKNIKAYEKAQKRAEAAKARKYAKRKKKRKKLQRQNRTVVFDDDISEEEPSATVRRGSGLFVADDGPPVSASSVKSPTNARHLPVPRKAPLQQSSSEEEPSSEMQTSGDSLVGELRRKKKAQRKADRSAATSSFGTSMLQKKQKADTTASETASKTSAVSEKPAQRLKVSAVTTKSAFPTVSGKDRTVVTTATTSKTTESAGSISGGRAIRTAPQKQATRAINFVNQPKEQHRKEWSTDNHYNTLMYRHIADKRSRTEGTPDFNVLAFVNGPPSTLPKAAPRSSGDPYGRRDLTNRRVQEEDPDDRPRLGQDAGPLADWEKDKVPLMCNAWKLSSNCPYGAQRCLFMHRAYDPQGRPYQLGDIHNRIPQKYRKPPITCEFWYNGNRCKKPAEECLYTHEDTGWTEVNGQPIERKHLPPDTAETATRDAPPHLIPFKLQNPPITCNYWLRDPQGCSKTEAACKYAHWNTGWAPPEHDIRAPPVQIDPNLRPRGVPPKYAKPPVTCPFWLRSETGCTRTDEECKYAHRNTGWAPPGMGNEQPLPIDPKLQPCSQSQQRINADQNLHAENGVIPSGPRSQANKGITCSSWLREPHGCPKSEETCDHSHKNTGWATPKGRPFDPPVALDPNQIPRSHREQMRGRIEPKYKNPPLACPYWLRNGNGCRKTEFECEFAHKNTGWLPGHGDGAGPPVEIDRNEKPRNGSVRLNTDYSAPKNGYPPITCYFWLEGSGGCAKSAANCRFAHKNTGWIIRLGAGQNSNPEQINPKKTPRFRRYGKCCLHID